MTAGGDGSSATSAAADGDAVKPTSHPVRLEPSGWQWQASAGLPLLTSAQRAGLRLPSSCRNGSCRACLCASSSGSVHYRIAWPGLSAEEKQQGWLLPCVAYPDSGLVLQVPRAEQIVPAETQPAAPGLPPALSPIPRRA